MKKMPRSAKSLPNVSCGLPLNLVTKLCDIESGHDGKKINLPYDPVHDSDDIRVGIGSYGMDIRSVTSRDLAHYFSMAALRTALPSFPARDRY